MNKNKLNEKFGSIKTPLGVIGVFEINNKITSLNWHTKIQKSSSLIINSTLQKLLCYFERKEPIKSIPIKLNCIKLKKDILKIIANIPLGETSTYGIIAAKANTHPRVVGQAFRENPLPIIIPCHRVITSSGNIGNYSGMGGVKTKNILLSHEKNLKE